MGWVLLALLACQGAATGFTDTGDPGGDTAGPPGGDPIGTRTTTEPSTGLTDVDGVIASVAAACPDERTLVVRAGTTVPVGSALLDIWRVADDGSAFDEAHDLPRADAAPVEQVDWTLDTTEGAYVAGVSTQVDCDAGGVPSAEVFVIRVYDPDGVYEDCVAWGPAGHVAAVLSAPAGDGERISSDALHADLAQISPEDCTVF